MANSNLAQIEEVFHEAMSYDREERRAYLDRACAGDAVMLHEVASLVAAYDSSSGLLDETAVTLAMRVMGSRPDDSMVGHEVGVYKVLSCLGQGGMGTVYLAEDARLDRKVALKFLSSDFISDGWARRQLIKEAQAVARLDHPNISAVYGFEETGEHSFIVMQYIEGETLADLIRNDSLLSGQIAPLAQQIVSALGNAHAHGIIHRDIKPKNIMVTPNGQVKVLDFGLAKSAPKAVEDATESISDLAPHGLLVGTVAYMSPEQLRGEKLDHRTDIFSLGTVLYEMAAGKNPYAHQTNAEVISAIMSREPRSLRQIAGNCPRGLEAIVNRCLQKDPANRYQSAAELLIDLESVQRGNALVTPIHRYLNVRYAAFVALSLLVLVVGTFIYRSRANSKTLAVMAIKCEDGVDPKQCQDLTEALQRSFSRRVGLRVVQSNQVAEMFGANAASPLNVGRDLNAYAVMFGKVGRGQDGLMLTVGIERIDDGRRLFEQAYQLRGDKVGLLPQRVSIEAAFALQPPTNDDDKALLSLIANNDNRSPDAYTLYLQGRKKWTLRDGENIKGAIDDFRSATELDPTFAEAYAGLAECYVSLPTPAYGAMALTTKDAMIKAEWAATQALKFGDHLAESHNAYAVVLLKGKWDWEHAEQEFKKAIALNPDYQPAHFGYSELLQVTGRADDALRESELAMRQDPFSGAAIMNLCRAQYVARKFDQASRCLDQLAAERPEYVGGKYLHGIVYAKMGRIPEAIQIFEEIYARNRAYGGALLGYTYAITGRRADAERVLNEMLLYQRENYLADQELAVIYLGMDDMDHAFPLFRKAFDERFPPAQAYFFSPSFDRLRLDPRFEDLVKEAKLPPSSAVSSESAGAK
jgi:serine/threonine-protein kinase